MTHFCTYFDIHYIHKGLALYDSLCSQKNPFTLWILCFDDKTYEILKVLDLPGIRLITEKEFEKNDSGLVAIKSSRTRVEYYWTSTASLPLYIFKQDPSINLLIYLDADTYFFTSPLGIINELGDGNVLIIPHDYSLEFEDHKEAGIYNVGIMAFRNNKASIDCLEWWRERCIEWCFWKYENGQIGDQAYLNDWPSRFDKVIVCKNIGINAAPWNVAKYGLCIDSKGKYFIGSTTLICYHFHYLRICNDKLAFIGGFKINLSTTTLGLIYRPYIDALEKARELLYKNNFNIKIPKSGVPWRYIIGRVTKKQPIRHFLWLKKNLLTN